MGFLGRQHIPPLFPTDSWKYLTPDSEVVEGLEHSEATQTCARAPCNAEILPFY